MELVEQLDKLINQSKIQLNQSENLKKSQVFDLSTIERLDDQRPKSLLESSQAPKAKEKAPDEGPSMQESNKLSFAQILSSQEQCNQSITDEALDEAIVELLFPVKSCFGNGRFSLELTKQLGKLSAKQLESEIGNFYLEKLMQARTNVNFEEVQVFSRAVCKTLLKYKNVPEYGKISTVEPAILRANVLQIPEKQFISIVREEYRLTRLAQKKGCKQAPEDDFNNTKQLSREEQLQLTDRLFAESKRNAMKIAELEARKEEEEIQECTFSPSTHSATERHTDFGVEKYVVKQEEERKKLKEERVEIAINEIKDEAKFFRLRLSQDFLDEVYTNLLNAQSISDEKKIVDKLKGLFKDRYLELQKNENEELIKSGKFSKIKINYDPEEEYQFADKQKKPVGLDLELHRMEREMLINEEKKKQKELALRIKEKEKLALTRSRAMKYGTDISVERLDKQASQVLNVDDKTKNKDFITLYSAIANQAQ